MVRGGGGGGVSRKIHLQRVTIVERAVAAAAMQLLQRTQKLMRSRRWYRD